MKKIVILTGIILFFVQSSSAWWTNLYNTGTPWKTYYLGDYQNDVFEFGVNQETSPMTVSYGIGTTTNGTGWTWRAAEWSRMDGSINRVWKSKANEHQFTSTGNWYFSGRFVWTADGYTEYASAVWAENRTTLVGTSYFTVLEIVDPASQSASSAGYSDISLSWTKNAIGNNVMVVRYTHGTSPTVPTNGTAYTPGNTIGAGTVVYVGSATGTTSSGLNSSTAYDFYFYSVNNNYYSQGVSASATTDTQNTDHFRSKVTGNWETPSSWESSFDNTNWRTATLSPDWHASSVSIENGHKISVGSSSTSSSLTIKPTGQLTINLNYSLGITGNLVIQSDATGTGTFVDKNSSGYSVGGTIQVQQYLSSSTRNWYFSSPFSDAIVPTGNTYHYYTEAGNNGSTWTPLTPDGSVTFTTGKGYVVKPSVTGNITLTGTLNTGNITISGLTSTATAKTGFNLVGNPYPSYLDWNNISKTNVGNTMWYRTHNGIAHTFYTYNSTDGRGIGVPATVTNWIPPMQAFWVLVNAGQTGSLGMNNTMRDHQDVSGNSFRAPKFENTDRQLIRLNVSNGNYFDELVIYTNANAANTFDAYDSPKMMNTSNNSPAINLYTTVDSENLVIDGRNTLPLDMVIPVTFTTNAYASGSYSISANELTNLPSGVIVKIIDNGMQTSLSDGGAYTFVADGGTTKTFGLILRSPGAVTSLENNLNGQFNVFVNSNGKVMLNLNENGNDKVLISIYNSIGQQIVRQQISGTSTEIGTNLKTGIYVIEVNNGSIISTNKLIIK